MKQLILLIMGVMMFGCAEVNLLSLKVNVGDTTSVYSTGDVDLNQIHDNTDLPKIKK